jgi:3-oxoacyl-[acyl-carrier protein] reductase
MDLELKGHVALVQGASRGIGRGVAEALAAEGCDLLLTARDKEALKRTAEEIAVSTQQKVYFFAADSGDLDAMENVVAAVKSEFRRLDIIVCNSGGPPAGGFKELKTQQWQQAANLLVTGPVHLLKLALPMLSRSPAPRFFVITSSSTRAPISGLTLSNTFRPGIVGLISSLAEELAEEGVCCHSIAPGRFDTDRLTHLFQVQAKKTGKSPDQLRAETEAAIPVGRLGKPVEIGHLIAYLASPRAGYLTGQNWIIDGGLIRAI